MVAIGWDYLSEVINLENRISGTTRLTAWGMNWRITKDHLLFGTGPAGYAIYYMTYFPNQAMATHNNYLDMLAQTGIVGFSFLMWFFIRLIWMGWKVLQRLKGKGDFVEAISAACLAGSLGGLMMMFFGDWLFPFAYTQTIAGFDYSVYNWIFMGVILSLDAMVFRPEGAKE
jgi:O-antigen ligase